MNELTNLLWTLFGWIPWLLMQVAAVFAIAWMYYNFTSGDFKGYRYWLRRQPGRHQLNPAKVQVTIQPARI